VIWLARDITLQKQAEAASILKNANRMAHHDTIAKHLQVLSFMLDHNKVTVAPEKRTSSHSDPRLSLFWACGGTSFSRGTTPPIPGDGNYRMLWRLVAQLDSSIATQIVYEVMVQLIPIL